MTPPVKLFSNMLYGLVPPNHPLTLGKASEIPGFRVEYAKQNGNANNILIKTWGGIGDQVCAEPLLRWATTGGLKKCRVTLASTFPELFSHLKFDDIYDLNKEHPIYDDYNIFQTIWENDTLAWQFMSHMIVNAVDYASLCSFRFMLYTKDKNVILKPKTPSNELINLTAKKVPIHAGRHWASKTYPKEWWDEVLKSIVDQGLTPVLLGKDNGPDKEPGVVDVTASDHYVNLVNKTTLHESIYILQNAPVVFCSDSAVLHMAVTGNAYVGYVATAKHPDYIMHWRKNLDGVNEWAWRQQNFSLGGMWDIVDNIPDGSGEKKCDVVSQEVLKEWLPDPQSIGPWVKEKYDGYYRSI